ncbi:hypothetical protein EW145_g3747 [Phellinidium pouzarii]|uniref:Uncharacterized protein n=1 Tax=Phellinidium pouzarii TaxID=167371 RepID=A0A4S4L7G9_9AGAM|nr:hypothetical protein EW145_g3747 [Phellinidium pouzarii]
MIAGLSKAVTLYLAPLLSLTAVLLSFFAFFAPALLLQDRVALLSITPSTTLTNNTSNLDVDGPTVHIGALGSCSRSQNQKPLNCTVASLSPIYDLSALPSNVPTSLLTAPAATSPGFIAVSLGFSCLFVAIFTLISFRSKLGPRMGAMFDKPFINRAVAWVGLLGFMIGLTAFLVLRMWFGKAVDDFNSGIVALGGQAPQIVASIENGFTMVWVAYAFLAVPAEDRSFNHYTENVSTTSKEGPRRLRFEHKMTLSTGLAGSQTTTDSVQSTIDFQAVIRIICWLAPLNTSLSDQRARASSQSSRCSSFHALVIVKALVSAALEELSYFPTFIPVGISTSPDTQSFNIDVLSDVWSMLIHTTPSDTSVEILSGSSSSLSVSPAAVSASGSSTIVFTLGESAPAVNASGKWKLWPASEIDYTSGCKSVFSLLAQQANWPAQGHWQRIVTLSSAFHGGLKNAAQWVNSSDLRASITLAMDFWFSNDFTNIACLNSGGLAACPCGTPGFWNRNWFSNIIGIPQLVIQSCLLLNSTLTSSQLGNCTNISGRAYATFDRSIHGVDAYGRVHNEVVIQQAVKGDGIRPDGSFGQHAGIIYNGNYGKDYANDVFAFEIEAAGTQFGAGTNSQIAFSTLIDGNQWMIYRNIETGVLHWDFSVLGRFISFPVADNQATASIKINITELQVLGEEWGSDTLTDAFNNLSKNSSNANVGSLNGNRVFYDNDYIVQRGLGYVSTLRMYSTRTRNTECTNSQNPFGFHLSDGTLYTYMTGSEYEDIAAAWDFNLIPGTTVDYNASPLRCAQTGFTGLEAFVGGVSTGNAGVGAMRYTNPLTRALRWQKTWFFLESGAQHVMVGNLSSTTSALVFSVLDQRKHTSNIYVDGLTVSSGNFTNVCTLWHGSVGYMFPAGIGSSSISGTGVSLTVDVGLRTGNWSALGISKQPPPTVDLFAAWIVHTDLNNPVSYTAFPAMNYTDFMTQVNATGIVEIQNNGNISAILDSASATVMAVFWSADGGSIIIPTLSEGDALINIAASKGLLVILEENTWTLTVSDPTQSVANANIVLQLSSGQAPAGWGQDRTVTVPISLPTSRSAGGSASIPINC